MKKKFLQTMLLAVLVAAWVPPIAQASMKAPGNCGNNGPSKSKMTNGSSEYDNFRASKDKAVKGIGLSRFSNNEKKLPSAGKNKNYYEFDLGASRSEDRGKHRAVLLVLESAKKRKVESSYYTQNHYASFCLINK